jgi:LmbE family N-acetylglucosaminyl deacetylase
VLYDVVRVLRMARPLVITWVFVGGPTDGHGNYQVAGQMAQEAFRAAGDPNLFPDQMAKGLNVGYIIGSGDDVPAGWRT